MPAINPLNRVYAEYLEHSVRYYVLDHAVVSDSYFDELCKILLNEWDGVTHKDKDLTDVSALFAGSGFQLDLKRLEPLIWLCRLYHRPLKEVFPYSEVT